MQVEKDFDRFVIALASVAEVLNNGKGISEAAQMMWFQALRPYDIEEIEKSFLACVRNPDNGQFMPKPGDLIRVLQGTTTDRASIAWGRVLGAMSAVGAYRSVVFDDAAIHAAVEDVGGWPTTQSPMATPMRASTRSEARA